ncbi:hypothetical protein CsSME_00021084 [Camellia sinensis var. sinensis]
MINLTDPSNFLNFKFEVERNLILLSSGGAKKRPGRVFTFGKGKSEGNMGMKSLLGGKGANLAEMASIGLSVPPGLTISTEACKEYQNGKKLPDGLRRLGLFLVILLSLSFSLFDLVLLYLCLA